MSTEDPIIVGEPAAPGATRGDSTRRNNTLRKDKGSLRPSARKSIGKVTKKKQTKKVPPLGPVRDFPCRPCVTRATKTPGHECASQDNYGAACWDCAKNGHTCRPVPAGAVVAVRTFWELNGQFKHADVEPNDAWRMAAQRAAQQLRACGSGTALPTASGPLHVLAPEERKLMALETIAEAARLWIQLNTPDEDEDEDEDE